MMGIDTMLLGLILRKCLVSSFCMIWMSGGVLSSQISNGIKASEDVYISLPVFISSIVATAIFTWTVAKYDNKKISQISKLQDNVNELLQSKKGK